MPSPRVERLDAHAFAIPSDGPDGRESDGTLEWGPTTMVLVEVAAAGQTGFGYTYGDASIARFVSQLARPVCSADVMNPPACWAAMHAAIRNAGQPGLGMMAVSAVDVALWDLKARVLGQPLVRLLPAWHDQVLVYGSGGFTNYPLSRLSEQLGGWVSQGIPRVKLKVSRQPEDDPSRVAAARNAVGDRTELFVDANGALGRKDAVSWAQRFCDEWNVRWFEEPVSSLDVAGLRFVRDRAPALSAQAFCAVRRLRHLEYFHDHVRAEALLFDGTLSPEGGALHPDLDRPGHGLSVKWADAEHYRVTGL